ncbi:MAG: hypothetical protein A2X94_04260 [Bdellovibrionales bacterium GWB1_55_8]|nr:MAG: hypothetical protein A2X94_04260 [Bdellovibrionales bacterium GWB1_55_8]
MDSINAFLSGALLSDGGMGVWQIAGAIGLAYLGGVLSSLTPCVYPMIPITISAMGGMGQDRSAGGARPGWQALWTRGLVYIAGMAVVYSFLGVLAGLTGKVFGSFTNTSGWYVGLSAVLTVAALAMMDVLSFDPAVWWARIRPGSASRLPRSAPGEFSWMSVFALGASSGFIAAPCTTPVLASVLAYIANTQSVGLGFALMLAFSLGLGTLLLVVAVFAGSLWILPRSGAWMNKVKIGSGMLLLIFAEYLLFRAGQLGG